jgi:dynein regulatory complex subunit 2
LFVFYFTNQDRDIMNSHFHDLKAQMKAMQDSMRAKLTKLTIESDKSLRVLKEKQEKAEQILRIAEMCRKLETEEEKVLPFYATSLSDQEINESKQALQESPGEKLANVKRTS